MKQLNKNIIISKINIWIEEKKHMKQFQNFGGYDYRFIHVEICAIYSFDLVDLAAIRKQCLCVCKMERQRER